MLRKKDIFFLLVIGLALCLIALVSALPAYALGGASFDQLIMTPTPISGLCSGHQFELRFTVDTDNTDDLGFGDYYAIEVSDGDGNLIAYQSGAVSYTGGPFLVYINVSMASVTARPLIARVWDTDSGGAKLDLLLIHVIDPASVIPDCVNLPLASSAGGSMCAADGRINPDDCAGPVALYCDGDELQVYNIDPETGIGWLAFTFSSWPGDAPNVNTLLASHGSTELWHLDSGEFQLSADQGEGKTYAFVFNGCPYDGDGYHANLDPNE